MNWPTKKGGQDKTAAKKLGQQALANNRYRSWPPRSWFPRRKEGRPRQNSFPRRAGVTPLRGVTEYAPTTNA